MKMLERIGAVVTVVVLWIFVALICGLVARPIYEAFMLGFNAWSN